MSDNTTAELSLLVSREQAENAFASALRLFVGKGRRYSFVALAKGIGLTRGGEPHTKPLYDFLSYPSGHPDHRPLHAGITASVTAFLGAEFTNEWFGITGQGAFDLPDDEPQPGDLAADNCDDNATVVRMAVDGKFDRDERSQLPKIGARMMKRGSQLVAMGAAA